MLNGSKMLFFSGKRGLEVEGWEVIFRTRTPREIREEYERYYKDYLLIKKRGILSGTNNKMFLYLQAKA